MHKRILTLVQTGFKKNSCTLYNFNELTARQVLFKNLQTSGLDEECLLTIVDRHLLLTDLIKSVKGDCPLVRKSFGNVLDIK